MKSIFKGILSPILKNLNLTPLYSLKKEFLQQSGWLLSFQAGEPIDKYRNPIPWMTYSFIKFMEDRVRKDMSVFEYGCGNSTLWWADRVHSVTSCEHDLQWFEKVKKSIPSNVALEHIELEYSGAYCKKIAAYTKEFNIVVIDGRDRVNCAVNSLPSLKEDGVIIWDNSDREIYEEGYIFLLKHGYKRLDFHGIGPINAYAWCTSIFYREKNCLGI